MLKQRLQSAAALLTIAIVLLFLDSRLTGGMEGLWLLPLLMFFAVGTAWELATILGGRGAGIRRGIAVAGAAMVSFSAAVPAFWPAFGGTYPPACPIGRLGWVVLAGFVAMFLALLAEMRDYGREPPEENNSQTNHAGAAIERTCAAVFVSLYVGIPMALLVAIRTIFPGGSGLAALITMIAVTKFTDTGAYFTGRMFGRHKLIPRLSPGKTWEGVVGGIVTATIVAFACLLWLFPYLATGPAKAAAGPSAMTALWWALILGPALAVSGIVGDLAESLLSETERSKTVVRCYPAWGCVGRDRFANCSKYASIFVFRGRHWGLKKPLGRGARLQFGMYRPTEPYTMAVTDFYL